MNPTQKWTLAVFLVLVFSGVGWWIFSKTTKPAEPEPTPEQVWEEQTKPDSAYAHTVSICTDPFPGYYVLTSPRFAKATANNSIKVNLLDDGGDYNLRMQRLTDGTCDMAVYTIDSFITSGVAAGFTNASDYPARVVMVIDESKGVGNNRGADAIVAYKQGVPNLNALDDENAQFYLTADSPSEFMARVVVSNINLLGLPEKWYTPLKSSADVLAEMRRTDKAAKRAFVMWEPDVSLALEIEGTHVIFNSSELDGYIVDVMTARKEFLREHSDVAESIIRAYMHAHYSYARDDNQIALLITKTGPTLKQAQTIVNGIQWKSVMENYAHFNLLPPEERGDTKLLEDMIARIATVLKKTGKLTNNPVEGKETELFHTELLLALQRDSFNPGVVNTEVATIETGVEKLAPIQKAAALKQLTETEWKRLTEVGDMQVEEIGFQGASAEISRLSTFALEDLASRLSNFPNYYVRVIGYIPAEGDTDANLAYARAKADATVRYLIDLGVSANRLRAETAQAKPGAESAQGVAFKLGTAMF